MSARSRQPRNLNFRGGLGFTLIEILIVMVILGIILAVAFLSFGLLDQDRSLGREARRLSSLIELATDEATTQGRDFGLEFMTAGYRFVEYDPLIDQWFQLDGDDFLRERELDEGVELELFLEERSVLLHTEAQETEDDEEEDGRDLTDDYLPHVLIMSSGDVTPFELRFLRMIDRSEVTLSMSLTGELEVETEDDAVR